MSALYSTKIFQYIPSIKKPNNLRRAPSDWLNKLNNKVQQKTQNFKSLIERVKVLEQNQTDNSQIVADTPYVATSEKSPEAKGLEQHAKEITMKLETDKNKLDELIKKSNRSIISISSVFPWNFLPNTIDVEESRVTFIFRQLFSSQSHSVNIKDISNVFIESGFFFATLQIVSRTYIQNDIKIEYLNKNDATKTKDIIEGLRTFAHNNINSSNYEIDDLLNKLNELNLAKT